MQDGNSFARLLAIAVSAIALASPAMAGAIVAATGLNAPAPVALDGAGANVYFGQVSQSPCAGELDSLPVSGGSLTQLSTAAAVFDSGRCRGVDPIAFSRTSLLYGDGGYAISDIDRVDTPCGSGCVHLVHNLGGGRLFGAAGGDAYFMSSFATLNVIPVSGGPSSGVASTYFFRQTALDQPNPNYAAYAQGFYFTDYYTSRADRMDLSTHAVTSVLQGMPVDGVIATDSRNVYWSDLGGGNGLLAGAKNATCTVPSCTVLLSGTVDSFAVDESEADNPDGSVFASDATHLMRITKAGVAQTIYTGIGVRLFATDGAKLYFLSAGSLKTLPVNATSSTAPRNVAASVSPRFWTLNNGFYWTEYDGDTPGTGTVYYVAQQSSQLDDLQYTAAASQTALSKCSALAAVYTNIARTVLEAQNQHVAATGVKVDDFYRATGVGDPCAAGGGGADWSGNGTWQNPAQSNVTFGAKTSITAAFDLAAQSAAGPVLLQGTKSVRWMLATNVATVTHSTGPVTGISAYDPLSGTRVLLQAGSGTYHPVLILDPKTNVWCAWAVECPNLSNDLKTVSLKFIPADLDVIQNFAAKSYIAASVRP